MKPHVIIALICSACLVFCLIMAGISGCNGKGNNGNVTVSVTAGGSGGDIERLITKGLEQAYFEGQLDAINGDVRIKMGEDDTSYVWTKSPWDSGNKPIYLPTAEDSKWEAKPDSTEQ